MTHAVENFRYDPENHCTAFTFHLETDDMPEGEFLRADIVNVLAEEEDGDFIDFIGVPLPDNPIVYLVVKLLKWLSFFFFLVGWVSPSTVS